MDGEVAERLGVARSTVWRWRTADPGFVAELNRRREELWRGSCDRLRAMLPDALDVLEEAVAAGDRQAALALVKLARLGEVDLGRVGPTDVAQAQSDQLPDQPRKRTVERLAELFEIARESGLVSPPGDARESDDVAFRPTAPASGLDRPIRG
jgi:hypothetical protein